MGKILAIKGHESRGEEVIKILEMLGGKNPHNYMADCNGLCFYINRKYNIIYYDWVYETEDKIIFTIEEFLEKYPFKVGDKVFLYDNITEGCVTGMEWDEEKGIVKYCVYTSAEYWCDVKELLKWNNIDLVEKHYMDNMEKKLAIKGHSTRGKEVIELLEMMGGTNKENCWGVFENRLYLINAFGDIEDRSLSDNSNYQIYPEEIDKYKIFTLEEFLEKFPYKVGDKVQHKGATSCGTVYEIEQIKWEDNQVKYIICNLYWKNCKNTVTVEDLQPYKDKAVLNKWSGLKVELELSKSVIGVSNLESLRGERFMSGFVKAIIPPEGYQFLDEKGNVINTTKIVLEKKKNEYPTTYEDCCKVLGISYRTQLSYTNPDVERGNTYLTKEKQLLDSFMRLRICRNAYWKVYGEEIGLSKLWEPKIPSNQRVFVIENFGGQIQKDEKASMVFNRILVFPTEEMRNSFYENFKELIETVKELL